MAAHSVCYHIEWRRCQERVFIHFTPVTAIRGDTNLDCEQRVATYQKRTGLASYADERARPRSTEPFAAVEAA